MSTISLRSRIVRLSSFVIVSLAIAGACKSDSTGPSPVSGPLSIAAVSGDGQVGLVGTALTQPIVVNVSARGVGVSGQTVQFAVTTGGAKVSPASATTDGNGDARATVTLGSTEEIDTVTATLSGSTSKVAFVQGSGSGTITQACQKGTPVSLAIGNALSTTASTGTCLSGGTSGSDYVLVAFYGNSNEQALSSVTVQSHGGVTGVSTASVAPNDVTPSSGPALYARANLLREGFESQLRNANRRQLVPMMSTARLRVREGISAVAVPANPSIGALFSFNANGIPGQSCSNPINVTARVAAVSSLAIVVADTANPAGGFTDAEYASFAATFDTLVSPLDIAAFGQATDIDKNGKTIIFFTKEVNKLTPRGSGGVIGGFFHERDLFPTSTTNGLLGCATSNFAEMYYSMVPDPTGRFGDIRSKSYVLSNTPGTLAHEFQHLINAGRRIYVNDADNLEDVWLNEGLSHIAEELLYFHVAHKSPRANLDVAALTVDTAAANAFNLYQSDNFGRYQTFLQQVPGNVSPFSQDDSLWTRGATWNLLRYLADHRGSSDGDTWQQLVNSKTVGLQNLANVFASDQRISTVMGAIGSWAASVFADDLVGMTDVRLSEPTWNMRDIYPRLRNGSTNQPLGKFPLAVLPLQDGPGVLTTLRAGGVSYMRFSVPANASASIDRFLGTLPTSPLMQYTVIRTR